MTLRWNDEMSVGVPIIDEQHREMLRRTDAYLRAVRQHRAAPVVQRIARYASAYIGHHFRCEEQLMRRCGYPRYPEHYDEHRALARELDAIFERYRAEGPTPTVVVALNEFLCRIVYDHMGQSDGELAAFLRALATRPGAGGAARAARAASRCRPRRPRAPSPG